MKTRSNLDIDRVRHINIDQTIESHIHVGLYELDPLLAADNKQCGTLHKAGATSQDRPLLMNCSLTQPQNPQQIAVFLQ